MATDPDRLELMRRAKQRKVAELRRKIGESLRQLAGDTQARAPRKGR